jgi:hypothetical protein
MSQKHMDSFCRNRAGSFIRLRLFLLQGTGSAVRASSTVPSQGLALGDTMLVARTDGLANYPAQQWRSKCAVLVSMPRRQCYPLVGNPAGG